jgi:histidinol-phosphatase (PHP family)
MGGRFCMSDDSHGIDQVGFGYRGVLEFLDLTGIRTLHHLYLSTEGEAPDSRFPLTRIRSVPVNEVKKASFLS